MLMSFTFENDWEIGKERVLIAHSFQFHPLPLPLWGVDYFGLWFDGTNNVGWTLHNARHVVKAHCRVIVLHIWSRHVAKAHCPGVLSRSSVEAHCRDSVKSYGQLSGTWSSKANCPVEALLGQGMMSSHIVNCQRNIFEALCDFRGTLSGHVVEAFILSRSVREGRQRSTYHMWRLLRSSVYLRVGLFI